ncbi:MAG: site-specific integrase [Polyangiaceae bacterium]
MPPRRTGSVEKYQRADGSSYFRARVRLRDDSRVRVDVPNKYAHPAGGMTAEQRAELYAAAIQEKEDESGELLAQKRAREEREAQQRDPRNGETCTMYRERLNAYRKELGRRGGRDDESTWKVWIEDRIGHLPIAKVGRVEVEAVRDALDEAIAQHARTEGKEGIGGKRARNVWTVVTTTFRAACTAKRQDLRVRQDNPCTDVLPPERGDSRRRTFVYPCEVLDLLNCAMVPRDWRELYAVACYLYLRPGELKAALCSDVDLKAGVIHVTKAYDERAHEVKSPKTRNGVRDVPIHPHLVPLLQRLIRGRTPTEALLPLMAEWSENQRAVKTRQHLRMAGVTRPRLTENTTTTMHVGFRSWRDTGITWLALAGVDAAKIQRRAGHDEISTTIGYVKAAEDITGTIGEPFPPLPKSLVGPAPRGPSEDPNSEGVRAKDWAKSPLENYKSSESNVNSAERAGVEPAAGF